jgi:hypothetical protein
MFVNVRLGEDPFVTVTSGFAPSPLLRSRLLMRSAMLDGWSALVLHHKIPTLAVECDCVRGWDFPIGQPCIVGPKLSGDVEVYGDASGNYELPDGPSG